MKILFISDLHNVLDGCILLKIKQTNPDILISLGDIEQKDLKTIINLFSNIPFYGIRGNHDIYDLPYKNFTNFHLNRINLTSNLSIIGYEGCLFYIPNSITKTQDESMELCEDKYAAHILCAHSAPFGYNDVNLDGMHTGLIGLLEYIIAYNPQYMFHGHIHCTQETQIKDTKVYCVYGLTLFDTETQEVKILIDLNEKTKEIKDQ